MESTQSDEFGDLAGVYDRVPYASYPFDVAHPAHMATVATLLGVPAPDFRAARVLEIGSASGGHIIPFAARNPGARAVGVDISPVQVAQARRRVERLGLGNIRLECGSFADPGTIAGTFDYVIAHGILSWIAPALVEPLFRAVAAALAPGGIAYLSYSTHPGRGLHAPLAQFVKSYARRFGGEPGLDQARALLRLLHEHAESSAHESDTRALRAEAGLILADPDNSLLHDHIEQERVFMFGEVVEMARGAGLSYLSDTHWTSGLAENMPPASLPFATAARDREEREQLFDFLAIRRYRASLFCRAGGPPADESIPPERVFLFYVVTEMIREEPLADGVFQYHTGKGQTVRVSDRRGIEALRILMAAGRRPMPVGELVNAVVKAVDIDTLPVRASIAKLVRDLAVGNLVELSVAPPLWTREVSARPRADAVARDVMAPADVRAPSAKPADLRAPSARPDSPPHDAAGPDPYWATSHRHKPVRMSELRAFLLRRLDGTRSVDDLARDFDEAFPGGGGAHAVRENLAWLADHALLVG